MEIKQNINFRSKPKLKLFKPNRWQWDWKFYIIIFHFPFLSSPPFFTFFFTFFNNFSQASLELEATLINVQCFFSTLWKQVLKFIGFKARMNNREYSVCCLMHPRPQNITRNLTKLISLLCMVAHHLDMHSKQWEASISWDKLLESLAVTVTPLPPYSSLHCK